MNELILLRLKSFKRNVKHFLYTRDHKKEAFQAYKSIVEQFPARTPSSADKSRILAYATEVLGSKEFVPWLLVYTAYQGRFREGWIPDNYFGWVVMPIMNKTYNLISSIKTLSSKILHTDMLPDLAYCLGGTWYDASDEEIPDKEIASRLFENHREVYIKTDYGSQGRSILIRDKNSFNPEEVARLGDFVVQAPLQQHEWFDQIVTGSVTTLRITTVKPKGSKPITSGANLRISRLGSRYVMSKEALRLSVIDNKGTLDEYACLPTWKVCDRHPDTGFRFKGQIMPHYPEAMKLCECLHSHVPHFAIIGWDLAITADNKIKLIEWNANHPAIKFHEASVGPCFKDLGWETLWKKDYLVPADHL